VRGSSLHFGTLSQRGLNQVRLLYDPDQQKGWLDLTVSAAFNQFGQYVSSADHTNYYAELAIFSLTSRQNPLCLPTEGWPG